MADGLSQQYADLLTGSYDCVDRIVLNAYFRMGHDAGGFRIWWRALAGSDEGLDNTHLMRLAGRFSRRIRGFAKANGIPVVDCRVGERKHDLSEEYLAKTKIIVRFPDKVSAIFAKPAASVILVKQLPSFVKPMPALRA